MEWILESWDVSLPLHALPSSVVENLGRSAMNRVRCVTRDGSVPEVFVVARALAELITQRYDSWLRRIMRRQYAYLDRRERDMVISRVVEMLEQEDVSASRLRVDRIAVVALTFLYQHRVLNIEGMEDFLLQDISCGLSTLIDKAIDDYFAELEHAQFVQFLKVYLHNRAVHVDSAYVRFERDFKMTVRDGDGRNIGADVIASLCDGLEFSEDDRMWQEVVISTLVLLAPREIVFADDIPTTLHEVLWAIFDGHVTVNAAAEH